MYWALWDKTAIPLIELAPGEIKKMKEQYPELKSVPGYYTPGEGVWPLPQADCLVLKEISAQEI